MKRFLCLLLTLLMLFSFAGCMSGNSPDDVRGELTNDNQTENTTEETPGFSMGNTESNLYKNDFLGVSFKLPEGWYFYTDEQILELNNIVGEVIDDEAAKQLANATVVYDMYAARQDQGCSVNINMEKLNLLQVATLDIKQTLEAQIDTIRSAYENMGYTDVKIQYEKVTVDGKEFDALRLTAKIQGIDFYGVSFAFRKSNYLANAFVGSLLEDKTADILGCFTIK